MSEPASPSCTPLWSSFGQYLPTMPPKDYPDGAFGVTYHRSYQQQMQEIVPAAEIGDRSCRSTDQPRKAHLVKPEARPTTTRSRQVRKRRAISADMSTKDFQCLTCGNHFERSYNLQNHMRVHEAAWKRVEIACEWKDCQKKYGRQADLTRHIRSVRKNCQSGNSQ